MDTKNSEWYSRYLLEYLGRHELNVLYKSRKSDLDMVESMCDGYMNFSVDTCSSISTINFECCCRRNGGFTFDYDLIIVEFYRRENEASITKHSNLIKSIALNIAESEKKRVSIGFFYSTRPNEYVFYSINSDGVLEHHCSMPYAFLGVNDKIGKILFIHNMYKGIDEEQKNDLGNVKSIGGLK